MQTRSLILAQLVLAALVGCVMEQTQPVGPSTATRPAEQQAELSVTGAGRALSRVTSDPTNETYAAPSPDGSILLFEMSTRERDARGQWQVKEIVLAGVDPSSGARKTVYTSASSFSISPAWMPDGKAFLYTSNSMGNWNLVRSLSSSPNAAITVIVGGETAPEPTNAQVSPDGKRVAFSTRMRDNRVLAIANIDGGQLTLLGEGDAPSWSPDGKLLAFVRRVNGLRQIFTVDADTGTQLSQLTSGEYEADQPDWSPDGRFLVFDSNRGWNTVPGGNRETTWNLFIVRADGTGITQLTNGPMSSQRPAWGRDGWIYFESDQAGNFDIWRLRPSDELVRGGTQGASDGGGAGFGEGQP